METVKTPLICSKRGSALLAAIVTCMVILSLSAGMIAIRSQISDNSVKTTEVVMFDMFGSRVCANAFMQNWKSLADLCGKNATVTVAPVPVVKLDDVDFISLVGTSASTSNLTASDCRDFWYPLSSDETAVAVAAIANNTHRTDSFKNLMCRVLTDTKVVSSFTGSSSKAVSTLELQVRSFSATAFSFVDLRPSVILNGDSSFGTSQTWNGLSYVLGALLLPSTPTGITFNAPVVAFNGVLPSSQDTSYITAVLANATVATSFAIPTVGFTDTFLTLQQSTLGGAITTNDTVRGEILPAIHSIQEIIDSLSTATNMLVISVDSVSGNLSATLNANDVSPSFISCATVIPAVTINATTYPAYVSLNIDLITASYQTIGGTGLKLFISDITGASFVAIKASGAALSDATIASRQPLIIQDSFGGVSSHKNLLIAPSIVVARSSGSTANVYASILTSGFESESPRSSFGVINTPLNSGVSVISTDIANVNIYGSLLIWDSILTSQSLPGTRAIINILGDHLPNTTGTLGQGKNSPFGSPAFYNLFIASESCEKGVIVQP